MSINLTRVPKTTTGIPKSVLSPPEGSRVETISPNWCDCTTWYQESTKVTDEVYSDSGDGLTFNPATSRCCVDVTHGKLTGEHLLFSYAPVVKVDDVVKTEHSPETTDADYSVNYATGDVTFDTSQSGKTVKVTYHYTGSSLWTVKPTAGKILRVTVTEVQFSENVELKDTVIFQLYVAGNPYGQPVKYKTMMDYINESSRAYPSIPAMGGTGWRGTQHPVHIFQWPYAERGAFDLRSSLGMEIRISLENDTVFTGDFAVATFYGISEDE